MKPPMCVDLCVMVSRCVAAMIFVRMAAPLPAAERHGNWSDGARLIAAMDFFERISAEFEGRVKRLQDEGAAAPVLALPLVQSILSNKSGADREIERYVEGNLSAAQSDKVTGRALAELEKARGSLAKAEAKAAKQWAVKYKTGMKEVEQPPEAQAFIYEMQVTARRLGVLLDNSSSMTAALPALRKTIGGKFRNTRFAEVDGCRLRLDRESWGPYGEWQFATPLDYRNPFEPRWFLPEIPQKDIHYHSVEWERNAMAAFRSMVTLMEVDAIYWFTDFDDKIDNSTALALEKLLTDKKVRLYVHTVKSAPPGMISSIIRRTGGNLTRAEPERTIANFTEVRSMPAQPVVPGFAADHLYQWVRIAGTVARARSFRDSNKAFVALEGNDLMIEMQCSGAMPGGESVEDFFANRCKPGARVEAYGMVTNLTRARHRLIVDNQHYFNLAPAAAPPVPPPAPAPALAGNSIITDLSPQSLERHLNQLRQFDAAVQSVQVMSQHGHVKIFLEGTPLYLFCRRENTETVFPGIEPLTHFTIGKKLTVRGPITLFNGIPQVILTRPDQWMPASQKPVISTPAGEARLIEFTREALQRHIGQEVRFTAKMGSVLRTLGAGDIRIWFPGMALGVVCPGEKVGEVFGKGDPLEILKRQQKISIRGRVLQGEGEALKIMLDTRGQIGPG